MLSFRLVRLLIYCYVLDMFWLCSTSHILHVRSDLPPLLPYKDSFLKLVNCVECLCYSNLPACFP